MHNNVGHLSFVCTVVLDVDIIQVVHWMVLWLHACSLATICETITPMEEFRHATDLTVRP